MSIAERKNDHISICLNEDVRSQVTNGFEKYRLIHNALPEADFDAFSVRTEFLGRSISAPLLISSMTGGTEHGERINRNLAEAAAALELPLAVGSQRVYLAGESSTPVPFRRIAPDIPLMANVGAVQLNHGFTRDDYLRAVDMIEADALILHLNPLQELIQQGGDRNFSGLLKKIGSLCTDFPVPVIIKEVGSGISPELARKLTDAGASFVDTAGAGGTSWARVESYAGGREETLRLAEPFFGWGIPTAECVSAIHERFPDIRLIASGGIMNGVEGAKAVMLGAELFGMAARLLKAAAGPDPEQLCSELRLVISQYRIARFLSCGIEKIG